MIAYHDSEDVATEGKRFPCYRLLALPELPVTTAWLFPEYDFAAIEPEGYADVIIERILERGAWNELRWLFARYGELRVREWVRDTASGCSVSVRLPSGGSRWTCRTTSRRTGRGKRRRWSRGETYDLPQRLPAASIGLAPAATIKDFYLAVGTALALQIGHRISADLDPFSAERMLLAPEREAIRQALAFSGSFEVNSAQDG